MDTLIPPSAEQKIWPALNRLPETAELLEHLSTLKYDVSTMLPVIVDLAFAVKRSQDMFPDIVSGYSRTILHREPGGFEVMVARWSRGAKTPIHGHPGFSLTWLIDGNLSENTYAKEGGCLVQADSDSLSAGAYSFDQGNDGRFDNAIHQIVAVEESLSLHLYSDDALKGEVFTV